MSAHNPPYNTLSTADDVLSDLDLSGRRVIVTGATSGLGRETARCLAARGANVTITARNQAAGDQVAAELSSVTGTSVSATRLDLADRSSIAAFLERWPGALDVLINNAGVMAVPTLLRTEQGCELQFATNFLGPAELTLGLGEALAAGMDARVVNVSSAAHLMADVDLRDPCFERTPYDPWLAYARSKTAIILFTVALAKRWEPAGISTNAVHPGGIVTDLLRHLDAEQLGFIGARDRRTGAERVPDGWKTIEQGAATTALVAASPHVRGVTGRYFEDCQVADTRQQPVPGAGGVAHYAVDPANAEQLWELTRSMLGL